MTSYQKIYSYFEPQIDADGCRLGKGNETQQRQPTVIFLTGRSRLRQQLRVQLRRTLVDVLQYYFRHQENVYVSGNLFIYYEKGVSDAVVSPDVFIIKGISNKKRRVYRVWEEDNKAPNWVLEVTSSSTRNADNLEKPQKYAYMRVAEYFQYDPTGDYLQPHPLRGFCLVRSLYTVTMQYMYLNNE